MAEKKKQKPHEKACTLEKCPIQNWVFVLGAVLVLVYGIYLYDIENFSELAKKYSVLKPLDSVFRAVDKYSPFHEFMDDDFKDASYQSAESELIMTKEELRKYDGSKGSPGLYLAILGQIFDVSKGKDYYGPGGGYAFFSGRDASRAFVSGNFEEEGLTDDVSELSDADYLGLDEWLEFYRKDYEYIGKVVGRFYDSKGQETEYGKQVQKWIWKARDEAEEHSAEKKMFPPCNTEWSQKKGHRVWCTKKSGGIERNWVGVPRALFYPGRKERCACVRDSGPPSTDLSAKTDFGDLKSPHVKEYNNCDPKSASCLISPPEKSD